MKYYKSSSASAIGVFTALILYIVLVSAIIYGWIANIVIIAHSNFSELTGILLLRIVGIFVGPLGVVLGYI